MNQSSLLVISITPLRAHFLLFYQLKSLFKGQNQIYIDAEILHFIAKMSRVNDVINNFLRY